MLGPPGAGKGTQAALLAEKFGVAHVSTGDILRAAVAAETDVGLRAKSYMDAGNLIPDDVMLEVIRERLSDPDAKEGFVLDGFPRTVVQAQALLDLLADAGTPIERVVLIDVPDEAIIERIESRLSCPRCGRVYSMKTRKPRHDQLCDVDETPLVRRSDESEDVVRKRLGIYRDQTMPVIGFYADCGLLRRVDGIGPVTEVTERIAAEIA
ncbi:MAG TPA: adenylate kinase [Actinomycetota bacterium]